MTIQNTIEAIVAYVNANKSKMCAKAHMQACAPQKGALSQAQLDYGHALVKFTAVWQAGGKPDEAYKLHEAANFKEMVALARKLIPGVGNETLSKAIVSGPVAVRLVTTYKTLLGYSDLMALLNTKWGAFANLTDAMEKLDAIPWLIVGINESIICPAPSAVAFEAGVKYSPEWHDAAL